MDVLSNGQKSTTRRRRVVRGLAIGMAVVVAFAMPGSSASAGKPNAPHPLKPFLSGDDVVGVTNNSNACAGIYCHTYLAIMVKDGTKYRLYDGWSDISSLLTDKIVVSDAVDGTHFYKTTVHDFVTIAGSCGPSSKTFYGKSYKRFYCDGATTTYSRIYASAAAKITYID